MKKAMIRGTITCISTNKPVKDAEIRIGLKLPDSDGYDSYERTFTNSDGHYSADLNWDGPNDMRLKVEARGIHHTRRTWPWDVLSRDDWDGSQTRVSDGDSRIVDIALAPGFSVKVKVLDPDGNPVSGASSIVISTNDQERSCSWPLNYHVFGPNGRSLITGADGELLWMGFRQQSSPGERYVISISHPDYAEYLINRPEELPRDNGIAEIEIQLAKGVDLKGAVFRSNGEPIEDASVEAILMDDSGVVPGCHQVMKQAPTAADGTYLIRSLAPGDYNVSARHKEWGTSAVTKLSLPHTGPFNLEFMDGEIVEGYTYDEDGRPAANVYIYAKWKKPNYNHIETETDSTGRFVFRGLPKKQTYIIDARGYGYFKGKGSQAKRVFDQSQHATIKGRLINPDSGEPLNQRICCTAWSKLTKLLINKVTSDEPDGIFTISVPPGNVVLTLQAMNMSNFAEVSKKVKSGGVYDLGGISALPSSTAIIKVIDAKTAQPIEGAAVHLNYLGFWHMGFESVTDDNGLMIIDAPLPPFEAYLHVYSDGYAAKTTRRFTVRKQLEKTIRLKSAPSG